MAGNGPGAQTRAFYRRLADEARALPGVASVALTSGIAFNPGDYTTRAIVPDGFRFPARLPKV